LVKGYVIRLIDRGVALRPSDGRGIVFIPKSRLARIDLNQPSLIRPGCNPNWWLPTGFAAYFGDETLGSTMPQAPDED
jgi:hypothetical protein